MNPIRFIPLGLALALLAAWAVPTRADSVRNEAVVRALSAAETAQLQSLSVTSPRVLGRLSEQVSPQAIQTRAREIAALGSPAVGTRPLTAEGLPAITAYIERALIPLQSQGLEILGTLRDSAMVPVPAVEPVVEVEGRSFPLGTIYPNGPMPSLMPASGYSGTLVDARSGAWEDLRGLELGGSICLMDFRGGRNWERLFALGARAVIVVEDDRVGRSLAERLFANTPVPCPRFYAHAATGAALRAQTGKTVLLKGGDVYRSRPVASLFAYLPPTAPLTLTVAEHALLDRIAADAGTERSELLRINPGMAALPAPGTVVRLGGGRSYTVEPGDLLRRLAREYGVDAAAILHASDLKEEMIRPGARLVIPNLAPPAVLALPIDSVSAVTHGPQGGIMTANLAAVIEGIHHLAHSPGVVRRRGLVVAFLDGDRHGGLASRKLVETLLRSSGSLAVDHKNQTAAGPETYRDVLEWLDGPKTAPLDEAAARWFGENWLAPRIEKARIAIAEVRVEWIKKQLALAAGGGEADRAAARSLQPEIDRERSRIDAIARFRDETIGRGSLSWPERIRLFAAHPSLREGAGQGEAFISMEEIRRKLSAERAVLETDAAHGSNNRALVGRLREKLGSGRSFGYYLDLSDGSGTLGIKSTPVKPFRNQRFLGADHAVSFGNRLRALAAMASVRAGWTSAFPFYSEKDAADFTLQPYEAVPYYPEFWIQSGVVLLPLGTLNDPLVRLDTPADTVEAVDFQRFATGARTAWVLLSAALESPLDSAVPDGIAERRFGQLAGRALQFNIRSGIDANEPVEGATIYYPGIVKKVEQNPWNTSTARGARLGVVMGTRADGSYLLPPEEIQFNTAWSLPHVYAYQLNTDSGQFEKIANQGQIGTQKRLPAFKLAPGRVAEKNLILTAVRPFVFFPGPDPADYLTLGAGGANSLQATDTILEGEPRYYGLVHPVAHYGETEIEGNLLFLQPGRRARLVARQGPKFRMILSGPITREFPKGRGFEVGPGPGGENLVLPATPLHAARSMQELAERRRDLYARFGITDQSINTALARSAEHLAAAERALGEKHWQAVVGSAREAWGTQVKLYPGLLKLGRDAVFSVIVLMVLIVPAAVFLEKLAIGGKSILARLAGAVALFAAAVAYLRFFHPAFQISVSPFIVVIAFTMILMSVIVLGLSYQRFEVLLRRMRAAGGEVEGETISLAGSLSTALSLGVSNLKKRMFRTVLTALTVTVLTFSIVAFVSVRGSDSVTRKTLSLDADVEGRIVDPLPPAYEGALFRGFFWLELPAQFLSALGTEFGVRHPLTFRGHYIEVEGGNAADREGTNQVEITHAGRRSILRGVMTFSENEPDFSGLHSAVNGSGWFQNTTGPDRFQVILPSNSADDLGITPDMIRGPDGNLLPPDRLPTVTMLKNRWRVVGILDVDAADRIRDINGKSLAMVDYLRSAFTANVAGELINEPDSFHLSWRRLALVPWSANQDIAAKPRSVAIKLGQLEAARTFYNDIAMRLSSSFFAYRDGVISIVTPRKQLTLGGLAKIIVPVILCILIVTNTMLGTVEERKGEVAMLGAIGLSPNQISFLLLSESAVFSVLGVVFGVFAGLGFANLVPWVALHFDGMLGGLSFNFTSVIAMLLAMGTGVVVLVATLIPARKAAALAAPSGMASWVLPPPEPGGRIIFHLPFTLTRGNAVGMISFFHQFLANHTDATSTDFNCRDIRPAIGAKGGSLELRARMWLCPYDLDVSQVFLLRMEPGETAGVARVVIELVRQSGTEEAWLRTNYAFLDLVRRQFLLWRNLSQNTRDTYIRSGKDLLRPVPQER